MDVISGTKKRRRRTPEFWREVRQLVERGLSLKKASQRFGLAWSYLVQKAAFDGWKLCYSGRPRVRDYAESSRRREQAALEQRRQEEALEALEHEASVLVIDVRKAELLTEKVLKGHSVRLKVALSEWAVRTAENLQRSEARLRDQAAAMLAIKAIGNQLYGWDREPGLKRMKRAGTSYAAAEPAENPTGAVNLALIATTPAQLAEMAKAKAKRDDQWDPSATECNGRGMGPSSTVPEQPLTAIHGRSIPQKEAPHLPIKQPVQRRWETDLQQAEKANRGNPPCPALKDSAQQASVQEPPPLLSPQERRRRELEELARLRAEWRGRVRTRACCGPEGASQNTIRKF